MLLLLALPEEERLSVCPLETLLRVDLLRPESLRLELLRLELPRLELGEYPDLSKITIKIEEA